MYVASSIFLVCLFFEWMEMAHSQTCPSPGVELGGICYQYFTDHKYYEAASSHCEELGGRLADISQNRDLVHDLWDTFGEQSEQNNDNGFWVGAHARKYPQSFSCSSPEECIEFWDDFVKDRSVFAKKEPNNSTNRKGGTCGNIRRCEKRGNNEPCEPPARFGRLYDSRCEKPLGFVCQFDKPTSSEDCPGPFPDIPGTLKQSDEGDLKYLETITYSCSDGEEIIGTCRGTLGFMLSTGFCGDLDWTNATALVEQAKRPPPGLPTTFRPLATTFRPESNFLGNPAGDDSNFIDGSRKKARNFCRNPDLDPKGPWCFKAINSRKGGKAEFGHCDIPFCQGFSPNPQESTTPRPSGGLAEDPRFNEVNPWEKKNFPDNKCFLPIDLTPYKIKLAELQRRLEELQQQRERNLALRGPKKTMDLSGNRTSCTDLAKVISCMNFAAVKHRSQRRKDPEATPYVNHVIGVANILVTEGGVEDVNTILAAILHDTVEDTDTTLEEIAAEFGESVCSIVGEVTDDKTLSKEERKQKQVQTAPTKSLEAKRVKLADKLYNLRDLQRSTPVGWTDQRVREYFIWARDVVRGLKGACPPLEEKLENMFQQMLSADASSDSSELKSK
ncbi:unnamed protein product [Cyprideis torosa]|uniref:Guanosine-3',5'-bis(diphosphate) 3'-pyrophosphohydrolase MESH1 n=1 Tax=Cyprideis torosa TaxID=163714 RepID=A0A7R8WDP5_9CRUS|nr:unnamed protein product [Cyprideis torosa]CAG0889317.1 unnamed protein product [Cyprideis torosa]